MKKQILKAIGVVSLAVVLVAVCAQVLVSAQVQDSNDQGLIGSWNAEITIRDCSTGTPFFSFPAMLTYHQGGTMAETDLGAPVVTRLPGQGIWRHERARQYNAAFQWLNFDPARTFLGRGVVRSSISLGADGDTYTSTDRNETLDASGNVIPGLGVCATSTATRFK